MAQPPLDYFKKRAVAVKIEATEGVDAVPTAALNAIVLMNGSSGTEIDKVERPVDLPFFSGTPFVVGNKRAFIEGEFELYPPATPGQAATSNAVCEPLLLPSGMTAVKDGVAKTTRYNPISNGIPSATAYFWHAGTHKKVLGARNELSGLSIAIGDRFKGKVKLIGSYNTVEEAALPTVTLPTTVPTVAKAENTVTKLSTVGGTGAGVNVTALSVLGKSLEIDFGNDVKSVEYTTLRVGRIADRSASFKLRIARTASADFDPWKIRDAGVILTGSLRLTEANALYSELGFRGQIEEISEVDIDGDYGWDISGPCVASATGGDELYVLFGGP
ncbi:phage tail tube protein [Luteimonas sp. FXH3W]|uniref:Phage tail tube protein n=1 Tax=Aquilutibacter rugosus TaxID=3115820 RepID=A0ABU7UVU5_9GAMM